MAALQPGGVVVLENLRFNPGETSKDDAERRAFAEQLAALGDALVSDGFGVVHRKQASVYDLAEILPSAAGLLIEAELTCWIGSPRTRSARTRSCSAGPRCPTSSA